MAGTRLALLLRALRVGKEGRRGGSPLSIEALFEAATEATLIIDAAQGTILAANPAAARMLGAPRAALVGSPWLTAFASDAALSLTQLEARAYTLGTAPAVRVSVRAVSREVEVSLSLVRSAPAEYLLAHLTPAPGHPVVATEEAGTAASTDALASAADAFLITDAGLTIRYANPASATAIGARTVRELVGKSLTRWIEFSQDQLTALATQMSAREAVASVRAPLASTDKGVGRPLDLTVVAVPDEPHRCFAFWIREDDATGSPLPGDGSTPD
jgi:PAS domain S-box-containing protein